MLAVEMLDNEKVIQRQDKLLLAQSARVPENDKLILSLLNGRELEVSQDGIQFWIFGCVGRHRMCIVSEV